MPNLDLFSPSDEMLEDRTRVTAALDRLNRRFGHHSAYLGSIHNAREEAPTRIPFGPPPLDEFSQARTAPPNTTSIMGSELTLIRRQGGLRQGLWLGYQLWDLQGAVFA